MNLTPFSAAGHMSGGVKEGAIPLYLPCYLVRMIVEHGFEGIANGARKQECKGVRSNFVRNEPDPFFAQLKNADNVSPVRDQTQPKAGNEPDPFSQPQPIFLQVLLASDDA